MSKINIAIDGPSGVGKSSIAKIISKKLNLVFINTGLMYRAIAYLCLKNKINLENEKEIIEFLNNTKIELLPNEKIKINNQDITLFLWNDDISLSASKIAKLKSVRNFCVIKQQQLAKENKGVVMEGRDIGSVVLKDAELKIFLTASNEVRVQRRVKQFMSKGMIVDEKEVYKNIIERDKRDSEREVTPLVKVNDAIEIDTSNLTINEVIDKIIDLANQKMK